MRDQRDQMQEEHVFDFDVFRSRIYLGSRVMHTTNRRASASLYGKPTPIVDGRPRIGIPMAHGRAVKQGLFNY